VAAIIATGAPTANVAASILDDRDEQRKLLTTWTLKGVPVGLIDNIPRGKIVDSPELNRFLTVDLYGDRLLGSNKELLAPVMTTLVFSGNQIDTRGDGTRRILMSDLDAGMERPEERDFDFSADAEARADRAELVVAALTLLRAYVVAGYPAVPACAQPFGSFEDWSRWVRQPLVWAGAEDPVKTLEKTRTTDEERVALGDVLATLHNAFGEQIFSSGLVVGKAADDETLRATILSIAANKDRSAISPERVGRYLKSNLGRVVGDYRLVGAKDSHTKAAGYMVTYKPLCGVLRGVLPAPLMDTRTRTRMSKMRVAKTPRNPPQLPPGEAEATGGLSGRARHGLRRVYP
jgi:hypothetical protein